MLSHTSTFFKYKNNTNYNWFIFFLIVLFSHAGLNGNSEEYTHRNTSFAVQNHAGMLLVRWDKFRKLKKLFYLFFKKTEFVSQLSAAILCILFKIWIANKILSYKPLSKFHSSFFSLMKSSCNKKNVLL